jgi:hypothetical protein
MSSPAQVIRKLLIDLELVPSVQTSSWFPFISSLPDSPDTAIALFDQAGTSNGRLMRTGERIEHPGVQILVRDASYPNAWTKAKAVTDALDAVSRGTVVEMGEEEEWKIQNISRTSNILSLGLDQVGDRKRHNLSINASVTMRMHLTYVNFMVQPAGGGDPIPFYTASGERFRVRNST